LKWGKCSDQTSVSCVTWRCMFRWLATGQVWRRDSFGSHKVHAD